MQTISISNSGKKSTIEKITDRIKTFEDACESLGLKGDILMASLHDDLKDEAAPIIAGLKLRIIAKALNEGWKPNWQNSGEYKYYPWWNMQNGFSLDVVGDNSAFTLVGSRLCYKTRELATYAATQFADLYKSYLTF